MPPRIPSVIVTCSLLLYTAVAVSEDLLDVYHLAADHDPVFQAAQAEREALLQRKPQSRALLLPSLTLTGSASRSHQNTLSGTGFQTARENTGYGLTLKQPLFRRDYFVQLAQADAEVAQAEAVYQGAEQNLILRTAEAYFNVLAAEDNLEFVRAEKNANERQLEQTKQRFEVGLIAITDVHEAQAAYDLVTANEIEAENQLSSSREALRVLTGASPMELAKLGEDLSFPEPVPNDITHWSETALQQNLELLAAEYGVDIARKSLDLSKAGHYPSVDLNASYDYNDNKGGFTGDNETEDTTVSVQLTVPLYEGGGTSARVRESSYRLAQAKDQLEQQRRQTVQDSRDAYRNVLSAIKRVEALQQAVVSAQSAVDATEAGLEVGTRTTVDVLAARENLYRAQANFSSAKYDYILHTLRLEKAGGMLTADDLEQVNHWLTP